ncbi:hypothetical protein QBC39DRAFT_437824 [Podospora conica]|nr:hypothetical protein QBC39DRAFT_437824 [Schizothecium conicum]
MMHFSTAMVALASLMTGALALPGVAPAAAVSANSSLSRDSVPQPPNTRYGCLSMEQSDLQRADILVQAMKWCKTPGNMVQPGTIKYFNSPDKSTRFLICNYNTVDLPCYAWEIAEANAVLRDRCGLHAAWLIHNKPIDMTLLSLSSKTVLRNTTTTDEDGFEYGTIS